MSNPMADLQKLLNRRFRVLFAYANLDKDDVVNKAECEKIQVFKDQNLCGGGDFTQDAPMKEYLKKYPDGKIPNVIDLNK